jgi:hypothetical protein
MRQYLYVFLGPLDVLDFECFRPLLLSAENKSNGIIQRGLARRAGSLEL